MEIGAVQWRSVHGEQVLYECFQCTKCTYNLVWRPQGSRPGKIKGGCNKLCWECKSKWRSNRAHTTFLTGAGSGAEPNTHDGGERILLLGLHCMLIYSKLSRIMHGRTAVVIAINFNDSLQMCRSGTLMTRTLPARRRSKSGR